MNGRGIVLGVLLLGAAGSLAVAGSVAAAGDVAHPSPNPFLRKKLEKSSFGKELRGPFHRMRTVWDREFEVWPKPKANHIATTLAKIRGEPHFYLHQLVQFDIYFYKRGSFFRPFVSPYTRDTHVNFHCWNHGAELWNRDVRMDVFPFLYVDQRNEKLIRQLDNVPEFSPLHVWGRVENVSEGYPWIAITHFEPLKHERRYTRRMLRDLELAFQRMDQKDWPLAASSLRAALKKNPPLRTRRTVLEALGRSYKALRRYAQAREALIQSLQLYGSDRVQLRDALVKDDHSVNALVMLAQCDLNLERAREAKQAAKIALKSVPSHALAHAELGLALARLGDARKGLRELAASERLAPEGRLPEARRNRAQIYIMQGNWEGAKAELEEAVVQRHTDVQFHMELGGVYLALKDLKKARREFENSTELDSSRPKPYHKLGLVLKALGDAAAADEKTKAQAGAFYAKALEAYQKSHQADDRYAPSYGDHAALLRLLGKEKEAKELLERAQKASPKSLPVQEMLYEQYRQQGDWMGMENATMAAILLQPKNAALHTRLGNLQAFRKNQPDYAGAEGEYAVAVQLDPESSEAWANLTFVRRKLQAWASGVQAGERAVALDPGNHYAWGNLFTCRRNNGDFEGAVEAAEQAFRIKDSVAARANLAVAYLDRGEAGDAERALKLAKLAAADAKSDGEKAATQSVLGAALHATGSNEQAKAAFASADKGMKDDAWHQLWAGRCMEALGNRTAARAYYTFAQSLSGADASGSKLMERIQERARGGLARIEQAEAEAAQAKAAAAQAKALAVPEKPSVKKKAKPEEKKENGKAGDGKEKNKNEQKTKNEKGEKSSEKSNKPPVIEEVKTAPAPAAAGQ